MKTPRTLDLLVIVGLVSIQSLLADPVPLIGIDPSTQVVFGSPGPGQYFGFDETHSDAMIGYTFYLHQAFTVTQIGWFDNGQDGLSRAFQVGLWHDLTGASSWPYMSYSPNPQNAVQLLGNPNTGITIPAGTVASLNGVWRVIDLSSPLTLQPGGYELAGLDTAPTPDVIRYVLGGPSNAQTTIGAPVMSYAADPLGFHVSDSFIAVSGLELGPMLFSNVPEPSTLVFGVGVIVISIFRRHFRVDH